MFPGGLIIGESLGVMNMLSLQGSHNAIETGILAADSLLEEWESLAPGSISKAFPAKLEKSRMRRELYCSRSSRAMFHAGLLSGMFYSVRVVESM